MKKIQISIPNLLLWTILSLSVQSGYSQTKADTGKYAFSLAQAIDFAMKNQAQVQNASLDEQIASQKVKETVGIGLPQINASASAQDFLEIPTSVFPAKAFNPFAADDDYMAVQFGIQYSATAGMDVSQLVFSSDYLVGLQATKTYLELSRKAAQRSRIETSVAVTKAYYTVLLNDERLALLESNLVRLKKLADDTKTLHQNGLVEKIDLDRVTVAWNNLLTEKEKIDKMMVLAQSLLKFQMGMDPAATLQLTDKLADIKFAPQLMADKFDHGRRVEYSLMETQKSAVLLQLKRERMHYLPMAVLFGNASANAYSTKFDFFDTKKGWYPTVLIGGRVSVGIFDGLQTHRRIQQAKLELLKTENQMRMVRQSIDLEISAATANLQNASSSLEIHRKNIALAEDIYKAAKLKYEQGVGSSLEVMNAETSLKEAQTNYFSSLYEALVAKVEYEKATGAIK